MTTVEKALILASEKHMGAYRKSTGVPFIIHPLEVLKQIKVWGIKNEDMEVAALLHDTVEDTNLTIEDIFNIFGDNVATIVDELTFCGCDKDRYLASFSTKKWQSHIIKCADRICNVRDFALADTWYAYKYLRKADTLFESFGTRTDIEQLLKDKIGIDYTLLLEEIR